METRLCRKTSAAAVADSIILLVIVPDYIVGDQYWRVGELERQRWRFA
jgi:hypothetical protein